MAPNNKYDDDNNDNDVRPREDGLVMLHGVAKKKDDHDDYEITSSGATVDDGEPAQTAPQPRENGIQIQTTHVLKPNPHIDSASVSAIIAKAEEIKTPRPREEGLQLEGTPIGTPPLVQNTPSELSKAIDSAIDKVIDKAGGYGTKTGKVLEGFREIFHELMEGGDMTILTNSKDGSLLDNVMKKLGMEPAEVAQILDEAGNKISRQLEQDAAAPPAVKPVADFKI